MDCINQQNEAGKTITKLAFNKAIQQQFYSKPIGKISSPKVDFNRKHNELPPHGTALVLNCCAFVNLLTL